jgi:hypothetical protein
MSRFYDHTVTDLVLNETHWIKGKRLVIKRFDQSCRERNFYETMQQESDEPNIHATIYSKQSNNKKGQNEYEFTMIEDGSIQDIDIDRDDYSDEKKNDDYPDEKKNDDHDDEKKNDDHDDEKKNDDHDDEKKNDDHADEKKNDDHADEKKNDDHADEKKNDDHADEKKNDDHDDEKKNDDHADEKKNDDHADEKKNDDHADEKKNDENSLELDRKQTPTTQPESQQSEGQKESLLGRSGDSKPNLVSIDSKQVTAITECDNNKEGIFFRNKNF